MDNHELQSKKTRRKETQKIVFEKLSGAMEDYKKDLKEKKLVNYLKKISKTLAADIIKASGKNGKSKNKKKKAEVTEAVHASELFSAPLV
jgi:hypothetical protein